MSSEPHLLTHVEGPVGYITLNRPDSLNALSPEMADLLLEANHRFSEDPEVRCVVVRGNGRAFSAGADVKTFLRRLTEDRAKELREIELRVLSRHHLFTQVRRMNKPVISAVHGAVAGLGAALALASDLVIARSDAYLQFAFRHIGLTADCGVSYFLPRAIGERKALQIALLGDKVTADQALDYGIFNFIFDESEFECQVQKLVERIATGPTLALGHIKQLYRNSLDNSWEKQIHLEAESIAVAMGSHDYHEGIKAFVDKRPVRFIGR